MFFSFDGVDGGGKSTQIAWFCQWLEERGHSVEVCRDPGGTPLGDEVRRILLDRHDLMIDRRAEMFLYMASRVQLVEQVIRPALAAGKTVVSDRYLLANVAYQGHAGGLGADLVWQVGRIAVGELQPDLVFLLDLPAEVAAARIGRQLDRMEAQGLDFLSRVRDGFRAEWRKDPRRIALIDATGDPETVQAAVRTAAREVLP